MRFTCIGVSSFVVLMSLPSILFFKSGLRGCRGSIGRWVRRPRKRPQTQRGAGRGKLGTFVFPLPRFAHVSSRFYFSPYHSVVCATTSNSSLCALFSHLCCSPKPIRMRVYSAPPLHSRCTHLHALPSPLQVGALLGDVLQACRTHRVLLEARFAGTVAAVAVLEGLGRSLDPELDIIQAATPVVLKASAQRASKHVLGSKGSRDGSYAGGDDVSAHAILK